MGQRGLAEAFLPAGFGRNARLEPTPTLGLVFLLSEQRRPFSRKGSGN